MLGCFVGRQTEMRCLRFKHFAGVCLDIDKIEKAKMTRRRRFWKREIKQTRHLRTVADLLPELFWQEALSDFGHSRQRRNGRSL